MPGYRLYFTGPDGRFTDVVEFVEVDDTAAEAFAVTRVDGRSMELWSQARRVRTYPGIAAQRDAGSPPPI
jgi:hypothetical protein